MIIANWKANGGFASNIAWHKELTQIFSNDEFLDIGIAPSHIHFTQIQKIFEDENLDLTHSLPTILHQIERNLKDVTSTSYTISLNNK